MHQHSQPHVPDMMLFVNEMLYGLNACTPCGSRSPGHQTGVREELESSKRMVGSNGCTK